MLVGAQSYSLPPLATTFRGTTFTGFSCGFDLGTVSALPSPSTLRFSWRSPFRGLTTVRLRYNPPTCSAPVGADHAFAQPTGTFTSGLPADWSPAPPPDMTTVATGQVPLTGLTTLHPLEHQLASLQPTTRLRAHGMGCREHAALGPDPKQATHQGLPTIWRFLANYVQP